MRIIFTDNGEIMDWLKSEGGDPVVGVTSREDGKISGLFKDDLQRREWDNGFHEWRPEFVELLKKYYPEFFI